MVPINLENVDRRHQNCPMAKRLDAIQTPKVLAVLLTAIVAMEMNFVKNNNTLDFVALPCTVFRIYLMEAIWAKVLRKVYSKDYSSNKLMFCSRA